MRDWHCGRGREVSRCGWNVSGAGRCARISQWEQVVGQFLANERTGSARCFGGVALEAWRRGLWLESCNWASPDLGFCGKLLKALSERKLQFLGSWLFTGSFAPHTQFLHDSRVFYPPKKFALFCIVFDLQLASALLSLKVRRKTNGRVLWLSTVRKHGVLKTKNVYWF